MCALIQSNTPQGLILSMIDAYYIKQGEPDHDRREAAAGPSRS
jgi:hypothetical protein